MSLIDVGCPRRIVAHFYLSLLPSRMIRVIAIAWVLGLASAQPRNDSIEFVGYTYPECGFPVLSKLVPEAPRLSFSHPESSAGPSRSTSFSRYSPPMPRRHEVAPYWFPRECGQLSKLKFRTADGSCNNGRNLGRTFTPQARLLPPAYQDGQRSPRQLGVRGLPLPSARVVSRTVHPDQITTSGFTSLLMDWGQFIDHELVSTPFPIEDTRGTVQCCGADNGPPTGNESAECFPILFPPGDPDFKGTCMEFLRSRPFLDAQGREQIPREQENVITSFVDASAVYGSTQERQDELRDPVRTYLLRTTEDNFPPDNGLEDCVKRTDSDICFLAGDDRINEVPGLTLLHVVFLRYHNFVARQLKKRTQRGCTDECVFQQARAIVGSVEQSILYSEWLPIILNPETRRNFGIDLHRRRRTSYNPKVDPTIFNSFSTAGFRFGHSLIPRRLVITPQRVLPLRQLFFSPFEVRENLDSFLQCQLVANGSGETSQELDRFFVEEVTARLFENQEGERLAFDLVSLNIQRGRDHGIAPYNAIRQALGLKAIRSFEDLGNAGPILSKVYDHVDDIDLFPGAMSEETKEGGGLLGETFDALLGLQFKRLLAGDRFFFTHRRRFFGFSDYQLRLVKRITLAHVFCLTTNVRAVQRDVFRVVSRRNPLVSCRKLRREHPSLRYFANFPHSPSRY